GYASMLVAAKVDPENPHRAANVINAHPGVSHNYLRNHDFNIWFTIATEPDSKLGLQGTLDVLAREAGAESIRQLPTLKLFKIRMDLEMREGTKALATAAVAEDVVLSRVAELIEQRIIRQVTPIFDTRALGYQSMLVAAKVDAEHPWRPAKIVNAHPGVSHNYLRNHEFNMWFTVATEPDSPLGLEGTLEVLKQQTGAESVRQLPTLKLFKIRMDLEMSGDTETLAKAAQVVEPVDIEPQPYDELDKAVIRATQGDLPVVSEPYAGAARELGMTVDALVAHLEGMVDRGLLRRVAAILFHRRAGFSANGMGVWKVPEDQVLEAGRRMAAFRGISHCYERPTYADWPYQLFTMAHGRSKEECDAILDAVRDEVGCIEDRATLYSSTEFKKVRLLYFTDDFKRWEREHAGA
ncbi:MAG: siroheme decarboxylase, partial [Baekduia sp.]|nr:siroheme decarboxylase [Baekduia sp.]